MASSSDPHLLDSASHKIVNQIAHSFHHRYWRHPRTDTRKTRALENEALRRRGTVRMERVGASRTLQATQRTQLSQCLTMNSRRDDREGPMFLTAGPHGDFHVLPQSREKFHEASNGKVARAIPHQQGDLRLPHAENLGDLDLRHAAVLQNRIDLEGKLGLEQFLFGIGKAQVCKDVSAAFGYVSNALACFFHFGFHLSSAFRCGPVRLLRAVA